MNIITKFWLLTMSVVARALGARAYTIGLFSIGFFQGMKRHSVRCDAAVISDPVQVNPLLDKKSLPKFKEISSVHVKPALENDLEFLKKEFSGKI
jgi:hypothetical protein